MLPETPDATAKQILDAAAKRFLRFGYGKTTMSEIARDCNMSTGNLYRYFPSKLDIAETFVRTLKTEHVAKLRAAAGPAELPAAERLRRVLKAKLTTAYERFHARPEAFQLASAVMLERPEAGLEWEHAEDEILAEILTAGAVRGELPPPTPATPRLLQDMVYRFSSPAVFHEGDLGQLVLELDDLVSLFLDAMAFRLAQAPRH